MISPKREIGIQLVILVGLGVLFNETLSIPEPRFEPMGSAIMPQGCILIMAGLSLFNLIKALFKMRTEPNTEEYRMRMEAANRNAPPECSLLDPGCDFYREVAKRTFVTLLMLIAYAAILTFNLVDYFIITFIFATTLTAYLSRNKKYTIIGVITVTCILALLYLLHETMGVMLPTM